MSHPCDPINPSNVRDPRILGRILNARVVDVQSNYDEAKDEDRETGNDSITLCFDNGMAVTFSVSDAFVLNVPENLQLPEDPSDDGDVEVRP